MICSRSRRVILMAPKDIVTYEVTRTEPSITLSESIGNDSKSGQHVVARR